MKDLRADSDFGAAFFVSSSTFGEAGLVGLVSSFVVMLVGLISEEGDAEVDIVVVDMDGRVKEMNEGYE